MKKVLKYEWSSPWFKVEEIDNKDFKPNTMIDHKDDIIEESESNTAINRIGGFEFGVAC